MFEPDEIAKMEQEEQRAREARETDPEQQNLAEQETANDDPASGSELDAAWAKERERVEHERES